MGFVFILKFAHQLHTLLVAYANINYNTATMEEDKR